MIKGDRSFAILRLPISAFARFPDLCVCRFDQFNAAAKTISYANDGFYAVAATPKLFAEAADVNVQRSRLAVIFQSPNLIKQLFARNDTAFVTREN